MRGFKRWSVTILFGAALVVVALGGCGGTATPAPGPERQETVPMVATPEALPAATAVSPGQAPATPILVHLSIDKAPKLNEEAELVLEIEANQDAPGTAAEIELPPEARLLSGDLHWEGEVGPGSPTRLAVRILFTQEGQYTIGGRALCPISPDMVWGDDDYLYLTVKQDSGTFGFESGGETPPLSASPVP